MNPVLLPVVFLILAPFASPSIPPTPPDVALSEWTVELVHAFGGSSAPPIAVDAANLPHVLACPPGEVWHAVRERGGWTEELVANTVAGGVCGKLTLGPYGEPHVTFPPRPGDPGQMYAVKDNGTWSVSPAPFPVGDLAVDGAGVAYAVGTPGFPLQGLLFATKSGDTWTTEALDAFPASRAMIHWESISLDAGGHPHILYYAETTGDVRYAFRDDAGWHIEVVEHIGFIGTVGRQGSVALDSQGVPHVAYFVRTGDPYGEVRYGVRTETGWTNEIVSAVQSFAPSLTLGPDDRPLLAFQRLTWIDKSRIVYELDQVYATRLATGWSEETVFDGFWDNTVPRGQIPQFPTLVADACGSSHLAFYISWWEGIDGSRSGAYYATKGEPCESRQVVLDLDPDTLNLRSKGKWVTAYVEVENASVADVDPGSLRLNGLAPAWTRTRDGVLVAKFDRAALTATVQPGDRVVVTLTGTWKDGAAFTATDTIRAI